MAVLDDVIGAQMSQYPGVLPVSIPPPPATLERYPGEAQYGQRVPINIRDLLRRQPPRTLDELFQGELPTQVVPAISRDVPAPFGFHQLGQEPVNPDLGAGLPPGVRRTWRGIKTASGVLPAVLNAEMDVPHQMLSGTLHPVFRAMFSGAPLQAGTLPPWFRQRFPGLTRALEPQNRLQRYLQAPGNVLATAATGATEAFIPWEKVLGMERTLPNLTYERMKDYATGTTRAEREMADAAIAHQEHLNMRQAEDSALRARLRTGPLGDPPHPELDYIVRTGPRVDWPESWYEKKYGPDYRQRFERELERRRRGRPIPIPK